MEFMSECLAAMQYLTTGKREISKSAFGLIMGDSALDSNLQLVNNFGGGGVKTTYNYT